jgi:hypothetical protein
MTTFKSVSADSSTTYLSAADLADKEIQGKYLGVVEGKFGKNYKIETDNGTVIINGCGALNSQFPKVAEGTIVRLEYRGKKKISSGELKGKSFHDIDVQYQSAE